MFGEEFMICWFLVLTIVNFLTYHFKLTRNPDLSFALFICCGIIFIYKSIVFVVFGGSIGNKRSITKLHKSIGKSNKAKKDRKEKKTAIDPADKRN